MASSEEIFPENDRCEICGALLGDEVVIQEFADGSLVRLCKECAAGTALDSPQPKPLSPKPEARESIPRSDNSHPSSDNNDLTPQGAGFPLDEQGFSFCWPEPPAEYQKQEDLDPLERTRELLTPVNELIALQREMQSALERLAASLERFAAEMISESQGKNEVETRLRTLELELEKTRALLEETDLALAMGPASVGVEAAPASGSNTALTLETEVALVTRESALEDTIVAPPAEPSAPPEASEQGAAEVQAGHQGERGPGTQAKPETGFRLGEVQLTQRYYNESPFVHRVREIIESLGKPRANLTRLPGPMPRAIVTIYWDIVWYQYLVDLRRELPSDQDRVTFYQEGLNLEELPFYCKEKNAIVNDDGRLDASELEVRLLSNPSALITEMSTEETRVLDDITEEIWGHGSAPEFKWDD